MKSTPPVHKLDENGNCIHWKTAWHNEVYADGRGACKHCSQPLRFYRDSKYKRQLLDARDTRLIPSKGPSTL